MHQYLATLTGLRAVYQQLGTAQRRDLHARAAAVLADDPETSLEELYAHQGQTGAPETAAPALWELARHQLEVHRPHEAIGTLQQLLQLQQQSSLSTGAGGKGSGSGGALDIHLALGRAYREAREYVAAQEIYEELIHDLAGPHEQARLAHIYEELGRVLMKTQDYLAAETAFMQALSIITHTTHDRTHQLAIENYIGQTQLYRGAVNATITTFRRTLADAATLPLAEQQQIVNNDLGMAHFEQGAYEAAIAQLTADVAFYSAAGHTQRAMRAHYYLGATYRALKRNEEALTHYQSALALGKRCHDLETLINTYTDMANVMVAQKRQHEAIAHHERALDLCGRLGDDERTAAIATNLGAAYRNDGKYLQAEGRLLSALAFLEHTGAKGALHERYRCNTHLELAELYRLQQQFARAHHHLAAASTLAATHPNCIPLRGWIVLTRVELLRDEGHTQEARQASTELRQFAVDDTMRPYIEETERSLVE